MDFRRSIKEPSFDSTLGVISHLLLIYRLFVRSKRYRVERTRRKLKYCVQEGSLYWFKTVDVSSSPPNPSGVLGTETHWKGRTGIRYEKVVKGYGKVVPRLLVEEVTDEKYM